MRKIIRITESKLQEIIERMINEQTVPMPMPIKKPQPIKPSVNKWGDQENQHPSDKSTVAVTPDKTEKIKEVQNALIEKGFGKYLGSTGADGVYGKGTARAVAEFQKSIGVPPSGVVKNGYDVTAMNLHVDLGKIPFLFNQGIFKPKPIVKPVQKPVDTIRPISKLNSIKPIQSNGVKERPSYWGKGASDNSIKNRQGN